MGNVVNLNKFRKKKAKAEKEARAETNRRLHGRTKAERARDEAQKKKLEKAVRGAFLEGNEGSRAEADGGAVEREPKREDG